MRYDPTGQPHPEMGDEVTAEGLQHIYNCQDCNPKWIPQADLTPHIAAVGEAVKASIRRPPISGEAIEKAAMAILAVTPDVWEMQTTGTKDRYRWDAQVALESVFPDLMAQAWDEGREAGMIDYHNSTNPYRRAL